MKDIIKGIKLFVPKSVWYTALLILFVSLMFFIIIGMCIGYIAIDKAYKADCVAYEVAYQDCVMKFEDCRIMKGGEIWGSSEDLSRNISRNFSIK